MKDPDQIAAALTGKVSAVKMLMHSSSTSLLYKVLVTSVVSNLCCRTELTALFEQLGATTQAFIGELMKRKEIAFAFTTYAAGNPQYTIEVDSEKQNN